MTKKLTWILLLLINFGRAQVLPEILAILGHAAIDAAQPKYVPPKFHNGLIVINTDTIKGQVLIGGGSKVFFFNDSIERMYKIKNKPLIRKVASIIFFLFIKNDPKKHFIKANKVNSVRIFAADTLITRDNYMDFFHIGESSSLFRKIYSGSLQIFDDNYTTDEKKGYISEQLIVFDNGKKIEGISREWNAKMFLIKCINKKFNKNFERYDFRRTVDAIRWLNNNDKPSISH